MRSFLLFCFALLCLAAACSRPAATTADAPVEVPPLDTVLRLIDAEVRTNARSYEKLQEATETIGHRLTGSPNGARAEEYAFRLLRDYGYDNVEYFEFSAHCWTRDTVRLSLHFRNEQHGADVPVVSLAHSPENFMGRHEIIDVGNGLRRDFEMHKEAVKGKFALLNLYLDGSDSSAHNLHRTEKTALAIEYGVAGVIFVNAVEGDVLLTGAASVTGEQLPVPAVCVGRETAENLRARMEEGAMFAELEMRNKAGTIRARNVLARVKGRELPEETILIGGHLDSWDLATGAIDNGIGSFTVMEIARVFKKLDLRPRRSVEFALFMGEEQGLLGSTALVEQREKNETLEQVRYMINLDMTGNPIGFRSMGRTEAEPWLNEIGARIQAIDTIFRNKIRGSAGLHSDHQPFMLRGIPILGMESNLDPYVYNFYHSNGDDFTLVNPEHMHNCARFTAMVLYALAETDSLPAARLSDEATRDFLIAQGLREKLVLGKEWKWEE